MQEQCIKLSIKYLADSIFYSFYFCNVFYYKYMIITNILYVYIVNMNISIKVRYWSGSST